MVLGFDVFRPSDDPEKPGIEQVKALQRERFKDESLPDQVAAADTKWLHCRFKADRFNFLRNRASAAVGQKKKAKQPDGETAEVDAATFDGLVALVMNKESQATLDAALEGLCVLQLKTLAGTLVPAAEAANDTELTAADAERQAKRKQIGNFLHATTPKFADEKDNIVERTWGVTGDANRKKYTHVDLIEMIGGVDIKRGTVAAGSRGYFLKGAGVALELALVTYAQQFLLDRNATFLSPPLFMRKEVMSEVAQLSQFAEELYKVTGKASEREDDAAVDEKFLIATSEQPIASFHRGERLDLKDLPIRYAGVSECFRQEVGSHGRDTRGIFRVHQFKKIEQFYITSPYDNESWKMMDEMIANAEGFTQSLGLSYQVINIVSGALNLAASKKLDLEAWFPAQGKFRELVSCSNCTDYQARALNVQLGGGKSIHAAGPEFVHMLNSTLCATTRVICCILETFQTGDYDPTGVNNGGISVPEALRPFMPTQYREFIPFVAPPPLEEADGKAAAAAAKKK